MTTSDAALFPPEIESFRAQIDSQLEAYSDLGSDCPSHLREAIQYCLLAPGKRIRPLLVLTAASLCNGKIDNAMPSACAVEMIHNYSLIHDDLPAMDDDELRRGRATCHIAFDEATAILAGDALIPLAFEIISRDTQPAEIAIKCVKALAKASGPCQLVGGQADDLNLQFAPADIESLEKIHRRKTGALLTASLELGALSAGASDEQRNSLVNYGKHLGLAFQIVDDLLDLRGSQVKMGKRTGKDAKSGKQTYPAVIGEQASVQRAQEMADQAIASLEPFKDAATALELLARFVVGRTH
ncbi:MAG: polyprenyl synthetase family protein [Mariniblastus sp.]|nr:polyprenyl synthetase family protein [Mariniblastus sp.]